MKRFTLTTFASNIKRFLTKTDLSSFDNSWYDPGAGIIKRLLWFVVNAVFFNSNALLPYAFKASLLRAFGAKIGSGLIIKTHVNIKYPWKLTIGQNTWIGEGVWIDNLDIVEIGDNVCVSQGAMLLSGNHDFSSTHFDLMVKPIKIANGAWIGAKSIVCQGVEVGEHAVLTVNSVASNKLEPYFIYRGNPAERVKKRIITE